MQSNQKKSGSSSAWWFYYGLPLLGVLLTVWYLHAAAADAVYSDYIRLIDEYLPDVTNPDKFFVADVFTRIPAAFLQRIVNVKLFGFSVTFDRLCTAFGLLLCGLALAAFARRMRLSAAWYIAIMLLLFSLIKWEILLNGTAWAHVVSFGLFFINYELFDRYVFRNGWAGEDRAGSEKQVRDKAGSETTGRAANRETESRSTGVLLCLFPFVMTLFAGEYIAAYAGVMMLAWGAVLVMNRMEARTSRISFHCNAAAQSGAQPQDAGRRRGREDEGRTSHGALAMLPLLCTVAALGIYVISRHFAVWEHAGATNKSLGQVIAEQPLFLPRFFIKTFAGAVLGQETIQNFWGNGKPLADSAVVLLGLLVIAAYVLGLWLYWRTALWKRTLFPLILMLSGGMNHVLVTLGRWIFLREDYALSSRYSAQFMIGLIGVLLTFGLCAGRRRTVPGETGEKAETGEKTQAVKKAEAGEKTETRQKAEAVKKAEAGKKAETWKKAETIYPVHPGCIGMCIFFTALFLLGNLYTTKQELQKAPYREQSYEQIAEMLRHSEDYTDEELCKKLDWHKDASYVHQAIDILKENHLNVFR